jgi:hypothetical protein
MGKCLQHMLTNHSDDKALVEQFQSVLKALYTVIVNANKV